MKVKELKDHLATLSDDADVSFEMYSGCCGDTEYLDVVDAEPYEPSKYLPEGYMRIMFAQLPGYKSCIQAGGTKRSDEEYWEKVRGKKETT